MSDEAVRRSRSGSANRRHWHPRREHTRPRELLRSVCVRATDRAGSVEHVGRGPGGGLLSEMLAEPAVRLDNDDLQQLANGALDGRRAADLRP